MFYTGGQQSTAFAVPKDLLKCQSLRGQYILSFLTPDDAARGLGGSASVLENCRIVALQGDFHTPTQSVRAVHADGRRMRAAVYHFPEASRAIARTSTQLHRSESDMIGSHS